MKRLLFLLVLTGCVAMTPEQENYYALYKTDLNQPELEVNLKNEWEAAAFSLLIPGSGHLYLNEPGYAIIWFFVGLLSPISAPIAAVADTRTINQIEIGEAYKEYLTKRTAQHQTSKDGATTTVCISCSKTVREDAKFCSWCGRQRF